MAFERTKEVFGRTKDAAATAFKKMMERSKSSTPMQGPEVVRNLHELTVGMGRALLEQIEEMGEEIPDHEAAVHQLESLIATAEQDLNALPSANAVITTPSGQVLRLTDQELELLRKELERSKKVADKLRDDVKITAASLVADGLIASVPVSYTSQAVDQHLDELYNHLEELIDLVNKIPEPERGFFTGVPGSTEDQSGMLTDWANITHTSELLQDATRNAVSTDEQRGKWGYYLASFIRMLVTIAHVFIYFETLQVAASQMSATAQKTVANIVQEAEGLRRDFITTIESILSTHKDWFNRDANAQKLRTDIQKMLEHLRNDIATPVRPTSPPSPSPSPPPPPPIPVLSAGAAATGAAAATFSPHSATTSSHAAPELDEFIALAKRNLGNEWDSLANLALAANFDGMTELQSKLSADMKTVADQLAAYPHMREAMNGVRQSVQNVGALSARPSSAAKEEIFFTLVYTDLMLGYVAAHVPDKSLSASITAMGNTIHTYKFPIMQDVELVHNDANISAACVKAIKELYKW
jgi:hypothetical protein